MIYENATIITIDPERRIIQDGAIAVNGADAGIGRIAGVGKASEIRNEFGSRGYSLTRPGLISALAVSRLP